MNISQRWAKIAERVGGKKDKMDTVVIQNDEEEMEERRHETR